MKKVLLFAAVSAIVFFSSCNSTTPDNSLQLTKDDVIELDGRFEDHFLTSWEFIILDDKELEAILPGDVNKVLYDDGLYFISTYDPEQQIKVFDSNGHYLNDISRRGRARNEYLYLREWTIDRNSNEVLITNQDGFEGPVIIKKFDYKGEYLGELKTDSIRNGNTYGDIVKCLSDGTLLIENGMTYIPVYDYYYVPQNGPVSFPLEMREIYIHNDNYSLEEVKQELKSIRSYGANYIVSSGYFNPLTDTTYLVRILDNHIYRLTENGSECVANMAFRPQITEKDIKTYNPNEGMSPLIPYDFYDMKDYIYLWYTGDGEYVYDKKTSKVYHFNGDSKMRLLPDFRYISIYGNDKMACVDLDIIQRHLEEIESDDYDHRYSPEVEDFYRKVKDCDNPPIFIAHYGKK